VSRLVSDILAILLIVAGCAVLTWLWGKVRSGPGPDSRLERLLDEHEQDEEARRGIEDLDDESEAS